MSAYTKSDLLMAPGEGEKTETHLVIKARSAKLGGDFSIMEGIMQPYELLSPHTHKFEDQCVYVIDGELEFEVGGEGGLRFTAPAGSYVLKPRGVSHCFWNATSTPVRYIELSGRNGFEGFVDSRKQGLLKSTMNADRDWGMINHIDRIPKLMLQHRLKSVASVELPGHGAGC